MNPFARTTIFYSMLFMIIFTNELIFGAKDEKDIQQYQSLKSKLIQAFIGVSTRVQIELMVIGAIIVLFSLLLYILVPKVARRVKRFINFLWNGGVFLYAALSNRNCNRRLRVYKLDELQTATVNFSPKRLIRVSSEGLASYRAKLTDKKVAVAEALKVRIKHKRIFIEHATVLYNNAHPNIVPLHGVCLESENPLIIYELLTSSVDLYDFIKNARDRSWGQSLHVLKSIVKALNHLHSLNIFHGNLNLENIKIEKKKKKKNKKKKKKVYITDLGLFNFQEEQRVYTKYTDVYNLGLIMAQVLKGECDADDAFVRNFMDCVHTRPESEEVVFDSKIEPVLDRSELWRCAIMACACLRQYGEERPPMEVVAAVLLEGCDIPNEYERVIKHVDQAIVLPIESPPRHTAYRRSISQLSSEEAPMTGRDSV